MATHTPTIIPLDQILWRNSGSEDDPTSCLLATLQISSLMMHLEAIAVEGEGEGNRAIDPVKDDLLCNLEDNEGVRFSTLEISGRDYVLIATPYAV